MPTQLSAKSILIRFPNHYTLKQAYDIVRSWNPDTINYDVINERPTVHATRNPRFHQMVTKLVKEGAEIQQTKFKLPPLSNPPLNTTRSSEQQHQEPAGIHPAEIHHHVEFDTLLQSINSLRDENQNLRGLMGGLQRKIQDLENDLLQLKRKPQVHDR